MLARLVGLILAFASGPLAFAQQPAPSRETRLYPGVAPGSENWQWDERTVGTTTAPVVQNVFHPVLLYYPADKSKAVGTAMIVAPGGGFRNLMMSYEGVDIAQRLNTMGIDAFVLKYRLVYTDPNQQPARGAGTPSPASTPQPNPVVPPKLGDASATGPQAGQNLREISGEDGQQAVRLVRQHAAEYGVIPTRIGIIGFSAGGTVTLATVYGPADSRPDFAAPIYPYGAGGTPPPRSAPPLFIAVAADDQTVGYQGSIDLFLAWRKAGIPAELHVFQTGAHGFRKKGGGADNFMDRLEEWLKLNGLLTKPALK